MDKDKDFIEKVQAYFQGNPNHFGWILVIVGGIFLWGTIRKWEWIFQGDGRIFNIVWFSETFGERAAQSAFGVFSVVLMIIGIAWVFIFQK